VPWVTVALTETACVPGGNPHRPTSVNDRSAPAARAGPPDGPEGLRVSSSRHGVRRSGRPTHDERSMNDDFPGPTRKPRNESWALKIEFPGDVLLSHAVYREVPSGLKGLTAVFGMGTGVAPSLRSPGKLVLQKNGQARREFPRSRHSSQESRR
jgi:hypothetical protein